MAAMMKAQRAQGIDDDSFKDVEVEDEALEMALQPGLEDSDDEEKVITPSMVEEARRREENEAEFEEYMKDSKLDFESYMAQNEGDSVGGQGGSKFYRIPTYLAFLPLHLGTLMSSTILHAPAERERQCAHLPRSTLARAERIY